MPHVPPKDDISYNFMTQYSDKLFIFRKQLHSIPELSGNENVTSETILDLLKNCSPNEVIQKAGGYGIIATWDSGIGGNEIIFRAELDALPIQEINDFHHKSEFLNISHKCGHDGHSAILCGVALYLKDHKPKKGKVRLLFQSSEETGEGAKAMLEDEKFKGINPDYIFALHNLPGYKLNEIIVKDNIFTASVNSLIIKLFGKTSHAAEPEHGINPALALSKILYECILLDNNNPDSDDMRVVTPVFLELGEKAYGVSAGYAEIHFTLRSWSDDKLRQLESDIEELSSMIAKEYKLKIEFEYLQTFYASNNDKAAVDIVRKVVNKLELPIKEMKFPFKWGEDFGLFTARYRGCMFGLGAGENVPALHNPDYDFPDELIDTGMKIFSGIIEELTNQ